MSWLSAGKRLAIFGWFLAIPTVICGQSAFSPEGGEYPIAGRLPGDQTWPQAAVNSSGGYLVWQDNSLGSGLNIAAQRLNGEMAKSGSAFRVNVHQTGDQERPVVALLQNGGAVFVWQGNKYGFQKIYARFLAPSGLFLTSDVQVNTYAKAFQINPAVAALADGSVIIVWSSYGEDGGLQGIYGQRFSEMGARLGGEFQINEWISNQRTPAVAALANGNYVVAWVSELERGRASVDIYARIFNPSTGPVTEEFPVNVTMSNNCANPVVAGSPAGGFAAGWSQNDNVVQASITPPEGVPAGVESTNGWDVFARLFDQNGNATTAPFRLNSYTYGDQYAPQIAAFGSNYMTAWTSLEQDGSREGVFGQFLNGDGSFAGGEFQVNTTWNSRQMQPCLASDNHSQILAVWTSWGPGIDGFDLYAQRYQSSYVLPVLAPNAATASAAGPSDALSLRMQNFSIPNPPVGAALTNALLAAAGTYNGLFYDDADGPAATSSGYIKVSTTAKGGYSGSVQLGSHTYSISGAFDATGWGASGITRSGTTPLTVCLQLNLTGGNQILGCVSDGNWFADLLADRQVFNKTSNPATAYAGSYTLSLPNGGKGQNVPSGAGAGTVTVDASGNVQWSGLLADGTKVSQASALSPQGYWPLYASLYNGAGAVLGWVQAASLPGSDLNGQLVWLKPAGLKGTFYLPGFTNQIGALGSFYKAPAKGACPLNLTNALVVFSGGILARPFTNSISWNSSAKITNLSSNKLSLTLTTSSGAFSGSVVDPNSGRSLSVQGVLLEKAGIGSGFLLGTNQTGQIYLGPVQ